MPTSHLLRRPSRANELLEQGHARDMQTENQSPRHSPALWAVVNLRMSCVLDDVEHSQIM